MSSTENNQPLPVTLQSGEHPTVTQGDFFVVFSSTDGTELTVYGPKYVLKDIAGPVIMRHKLTSGRYGLKRSDIGRMIETDTVCHGILLAPHFRHISRQGQLVGPEFDYLTTNQDTQHLTIDCTGKLATYNRDIERMAGLDTYGHKGILLRNDTEIYDAALNDPVKLAGWHMPVQALVNGYDVGRSAKQHNPDNMYIHSKTGELAGSLVKVRGLFLPYSCWTASEHCDSPSGVYSVRFTGGVGDWGHKDYNGLPSRPVRGVVRGQLFAPAT